MTCTIKGTHAGKVLKKSKVIVEPGYFDTPRFIEEFGEWRASFLSEAEIEENIKDFKRFNKDGSPKVFSNKRGTQLFYINKLGVKSPIIQAPFYTLPLDIRRKVSAEVVNGVISDLMLKHLSNNDEFQAGSIVEGFNLENYFDTRISDYEYLGATEQVLESMRISKSDYIRLIKNKLRNLGVVITNNAIKQPPSIQRNTVDKASPTIKAMMMFVPKLDSLGDPIDSPSLPGVSMFMSSSETWGVLLKELADIPVVEGKNTVDTYMSKLSDLIPVYPWVQGIYDLLQESDTNLKVQFVTAFNNVRNNINNTYIEGNSIVTKNATKATTSEQHINKEWILITKNNLSSFSESQKNDIGTTIPAQVIMDLEDINEGISEGIKTNSITSEDVAEQMLEVHEAIKPLFDAYGIGLEENITLMSYNTYVDDKFKNSKEEIDHIEALQFYIKNLISSVETASLAYTNEKDLNLVNFPVAYRYIVRAIVAIDSDQGSHMVTVGKNRVYVYSLPSYIQEIVNGWKNNPDIIEQQLRIPAVKNSLLLQFLAEPGNIHNISVGLKGALVKTSGINNEIADTSDLTKGDYVKIDLHNMMRMVKGKRSPIFSTQVPADKGRDFQFEVKGSFFKEVNSVSEAVEKYFIPYLEDELAQMRGAQYDIEEAIKSAVLSSNVESVINSFNEKHDMLTISEWLSEAVLKTKDNSAEFNQGIRSVIEEASKKLTVTFHLNPKGQLMDLDVTSKNFGKFLGKAFSFTIADSVNNIKGIKSEYTGMPLIKNFSNDRKIYDSVRAALTSAISNKITKYKQSIESNYNINLVDGSIISKEVLDHYEEKVKGTDILVTDSIILDYMINSMISKIEYAKLFTGNLQNYKGEADYIKRVAATYIDGLQLATGVYEGDNTFTQITFETEGLVDNSKDSLSNSNHLSESVRKFYNYTDRTDAQGYITIDRWKQILKGIGRFSESKKAIYNKIKKGETLSNKEVKELSAQPIKGVYFKNTLGGTPIYLKYSQAVLIPELVKDSPKAEALLDYMTKHNIDEAVAQTGVKTGATKPIRLFDEDGNITDSTPELRTLSNKEYRIQQDLPTKTIKDTRIGVQVMKIILNNLAFSGDSNKVQEVNNLVSELSDFGLEDFKRNLGIKVDGSSMKITDVEKFYSYMIDELSSEEDISDNLLRALQAEVPLSLIPQLKDTVESKIFSLLKKKATHIELPGGAGIQISDQLFTKLDASSKGIKLLVDSIDRLKSPKVEDRVVNGEIKSFVIPGQVFLPHSLVQKYIPDYKSMDLPTLQKAIKKNLRYIIGYRIPTQAKASVDPLEVVGILPEGMGDSIIAYGEITSKTGSDFDIDKMFFMLPEMYFDKSANTLRKYKYEGDYYKDVAKLLRDKPKGYKRTIKELKRRKVNSTKNKLFESYMSILLDPKYYEEMMTSIDNDTFKESILSLLPDPVQEDMDIWDPLKAIEVKYNYKAGGLGIASSANGLSDHILGQDRGIEAQFNQGIWGNLSFDEQYSEALTDSEFRKLKNTLYVYRVSKLDPKSPTFTKDKEDIKNDIDNTAEEKYRRVRIGGSLSELINAFVDIANEDAFVTKGNWGNLMNGYGMALIRQGVHPFKVNALLMQPVLRELTNSVMNSEGLINNVATHKIERDLMDRVVRSLRKDGIDFNKLKEVNNYTLDNLSYEELVDIAKNGKTSSKEEMLTQAIVLYNYIKMKEPSRKYNSFVVASKADTEGAGGSTSDLFLRLNRLSDSLEMVEDVEGGLYGIRNGYKKFFDNHGNISATYTMNVNTLNFMLSILEDNPLLFDGVNVGTFMDFNNIAEANLKSSRLTKEDDVNNIMEAFRIYKLSGFLPLTEKLELSKELELLKKFKEIKASRKNELINRISFIEKLDSENNLEGVEFIIENLSRRSNESKDLLSDGWRDLLKNEPELGNFLIKKAYEKSNFKPSPLQFHEVIPFEWFLDNGYINYVTGKTSSGEVIPEIKQDADDIFLDQFVRTNEGRKFLQPLNKMSSTNIGGEVFGLLPLNDGIRMGMTDSKIFKAPQYGVYDGKVTMKLVGIISIEGKDNKGRKKVFNNAFYQPISSLDNYIYSDEAFAEFRKDELKKEDNFKESARNQYIKGGQKVAVRDLSNLPEDFFLPGGALINLEASRARIVSMTEERIKEEQMCNTNS